MFHDKRIWHLSVVATPEEMANKLSKSTWTLCTAFCVAGHEQYLFLNDSTHEDGAGEWAIVKKLPDGSYVQTESITFGWCDYEVALGYIQRIVSGEFDVINKPVTPNLNHGQTRCHHCA